MAEMLRCLTSGGPVQPREATPVAQCRGRRSRAAVRCAHRAATGKVAAAAVAEVAAAGAVAGKGLAKQLRLGSLVEDGLSYKESFIVRSYEVGINKTATVETIANLLQEVGCNHAQSVGYSTDGFATTPTMRKLGLIWVTARMHIEIYKYPAWGEAVQIETWCQGEGRIGTRRDFIIKDLATNKVIGRATSQNESSEATESTGKDSPGRAWSSFTKEKDSKWVMMNQETRKLQRVSDDVREEVLVYCPRTLRLAFPEENNDSLKKIAKLDDPAQCFRLGLVPRRADLDMNQHVNNVTYIGWILESMPQEIINTHELQTITLDYRRECQHNDMVDSLTSSEVAEDGNTNAPAYVQELLPFLHFLRLSGTGLEINRGRTQWRKLAH